MVEGFAYGRRAKIESFMKKRDLFQLVCALALASIAIPKVSPRLPDLTQAKIYSSRFPRLFDCFKWKT